MKEIVGKEELKEVLNYIEERRDRCIYLYVNLANYDASDKNIRVFIDDEQNNHAVFLFYYNTLHISYDFLTQNDVEKYISFVKSIEPQVIFLPKQEDAFVKRLSEDYECFSMNVYNYPKCGVFDPNVKEATFEDYLEIADFMYKDPTYSHSYSSSSELYSQLINRFNDGQGRYFFITHEGKIVAVEGINAENNSVAILGGLLVDSNMRGMGLAKRIKLGIHYILQDQKVIYCLINNPISESMTIKLGGYIVSSMFKMIKRS